MTIASYVGSNTQRVLIFRRPGAKIYSVFYEILLVESVAMQLYGVGV